MTGFKKQLRELLGIKVFRFNSPCLYCGQNMRVAPGQLAYFHRKCRTQGRELVKKSLKKTNYGQNKKNNN